MNRNYPTENDKNEAIKFLFQENKYDIPDLEDFVA
jgi:hypothetical protein